MQKEKSLEWSYWKNDNEMSAARAIALGAGELNISVRQEIEKVLKTNGNNIVKSFNSLLQTLLERTLISDNEKKQLANIFILLLNAIRKKGDAEDAFFSIKKIHNEMAIMNNSSPVALAISSVASSSFSFAKSNSVSVTPHNTGTGALIGAGIGAGIGALVGGGLGAAIGAAVGAAAGAAIGLCNESGT